MWSRGFSHRGFNQFLKGASLCSAISIFSIPVAPASAQAQSALEEAIAGLEWREIGPATPGGRISDLAVDESRPRIFYVGTASGGVFKTTNAGMTFVPIFDDQSTSSIGDVTLAPSNPNIVWVGTGEPQNRQSSPWGDGVYKSMDGGLTWRHLGLNETRHIARILIHPTNPDVVYLAAVGHLWGPNPERGVYRTTDGGETWELVLFIDENTGAIDLAMDPGDPETLFAAMYQRRRTGFGFNGGGPGSGLYRSLDGGDSWQELTEGLPVGDKGRIGMAIYRQDGNLVYAVIQAETGPSGEGQNGLYRSTDRGESWEKVSDTNPRPMYYSHLRIDPNDPERIYVLGTQLSISEDGGRTFSGEGAPGVHVDHHAIWVNPHDSDHIILGSDGGVSRSYDRGQSWDKYDNLSLGQFYRVGVDMRDPYYVCGGLQDNSPWCGPSRTFNTYGIRNDDWYDIWGGDGFFAVPDPNDHTTVYTESQGGNMGRYDVTTGARTNLRPVARPSDEEDDRTLRFNWDTPIIISAHDSETIYVGANLVFKSTDRGVNWEEISTDLTKNLDRSEMPIMGAVEADGLISRHDGISTYGNITTLAESPLDPDVLYAGTDDGNVQVTRDGGVTWENVVDRIPDLPERTYVSRLTPSRFEAGTVYASFDGHRNDDYAPHVYVSTDFGNGWREISEGLPEWSVNVMVEHHRTPDLLFVGNEIGVYFSTDGGDSWVRLKNNLPTVPVDDIVIHPRENDLVIGTHGRSVWILPDVTPLEQLTAEVLASPAHLFPTKPASMYFIAGAWPFQAGRYSNPNPPNGAPIRYYLGEANEDAEAGVEGDDPEGDDLDADGARVELSILDARGGVVRTLEGGSDAGINQIVWDFRMNPPYTPEAGGAGAGRGGGGGGRGGGPAAGPKVLPGTYTVRLEAAGRTATTELEVRGDPRVDISPADLRAKHNALMSLHELQEPVYRATQAVRRLVDLVADARRLLREEDDTPEALTALVDTLSDDLEELNSDLNEAARDTRLQRAIEGSEGPPTGDQLWQIDRAWERVPPLLERVNEVITTRVPEMNRELNSAGIRALPGELIPIPRRSGG